MSYRALKALASLILCAMLACTQQAAAGGDKSWADCQVVEEESVAKYTAPESKRTDPEDLAVQPAGIQTTGRAAADLTPVIVLSGPAPVTQATSIRDPPVTRNISA